MRKGTIVISEFLQGSSEERNELTTNKLINGIVILDGKVIAADF